jgi:hypothetical protein
VIRSARPYELIDRDDGRIAKWMAPGYSPRSRSRSQAKHKPGGSWAGAWNLAKPIARSAPAGGAKRSSRSSTSRDSFPRVPITRMTEAERSLLASWLVGPADAIRKALARRVPPASSCIATAQPVRTSGPPRRAGRLLAWRSARLAGPLVTTPRRRPRVMVLAGQPQHCRSASTPRGPRRGCPGTRLPAKARPARRPASVT